MRTAIITTSYPLRRGSYAGHFVAAEAKALQCAGREVVVCAPGAVGERWLDGIRVVTLGSEQLFQPPGALPRLKSHPHLLLQALTFALLARKWLKAHGPFSSVQAHWLVPCAWPIAVAAPAPTQFEFICHGSDLRLIQRLPKIIQRMLLNQIGASGATLRCVSEQLKQELIALAPSLADRTLVRPCPISLDLAPSRAEARKRLSIAHDTALILIVARLISGKRVDVALGALPSFIASRADSPIKVAVVGAGPELDRLKSRFAFAQFLGELPHDQTLHWLAAADLLLSASEQEGAPTVVREARALGVPVVSARAGDLHDWAASDSGLHLFESEANIPTTIERALLSKAQA